ncbi:MAG TPA: DNA circularization N-terminal domain-containing protein [Sphingobium sp.]
MSWRDTYQQGSFRGVEFATISHNMTGGRRVETHEFPGRDEPIAEDLGRKARQFSIECFIVGRDYYADRDMLIDALEAEGPATLIHPWHGSRWVSVLDFSIGEDQAGGYASFSITFGEAGSEPSLAASPDTAAQATALADKTLDEAPAKFAGRFSLDSLPGFVSDATGKLVSIVAVASEISAGLSGGPGGLLNAFEGALRLVGADGLLSTLRTPLALGHALVGLISAVSVLGGIGTRQTAALRIVGESLDGLDSIPAATPARAAQSENQSAIVHLVRSAVAAEMLAITAATDFASYDDAARVQQDFAVMLDRWSLDAADAGEDERADLFDALRLALVRDVTARGGSLARQYGYPLASTQPVLVVAARLYGPLTDLDDRAADLVARNSVRHPGFVPGAAELQVLTNG